MTLISPPQMIPAGDWPDQGAWTYADYSRLPDTGWRYEIIEGGLHMAPAPHPAHQEASNTLSTALTNYVKQHQSGKIFYAPIDVLLPAENTNVQPDILFLAQDRLDLISDRGIEGPPDLIIEILSPSNWIIDRQDKFVLYEKSGVKEYWIVDIKQQTIEVYALTAAGYGILGKYQGSDQAPSRQLKGFSIPVDEVCAG
jgi:Uma2 family endonuclease